MACIGEKHKVVNHQIAVLEVILLENVDSDAFVWKVITTRDFRPAELVDCQVLDI